MITEQVKKLTCEMRLYGMHAALERRNKEADAQNLSPVEFLRLLLEDERLARKDQLAKRLITRARFRSSADLEDWDVTSDRGLSKAKLKELAELDFYQQRENLVILGKTGAGKTHLAIALGRRACLHGLTTQFLPVNFLCEEIKASKAAGRYLIWIKYLTKINILVLDDFGLRSYTHEEACALLDLLEERYQKGTLIITSQVDPKGWKTLFEDPVIAEAIVDRLKNPSLQITLTGNSYREKLKKGKA
jgi:DNA replication protein DnaC